MDTRPVYNRPLILSQELEPYISRSGWIVCVVRLAAVRHSDLGLAAAVRAFISGELSAVLPAEVTRWRLRSPALVIPLPRSPTACHQGADSHQVCPPPAIRAGPPTCFVAPSVTARR